MTTSEPIHRPGKDEYMRILGACAHIARNPGIEGHVTALAAYGKATVAAAISRQERLNFQAAISQAPEALKGPMQSSDLLMQLEEIARHFILHQRVPMSSNAIHASVEAHAEETHSAMRMLDRNSGSEGIAHAFACHLEDVVLAVLSVRFYTLQMRIKEHWVVLEEDARQNAKMMLRLFSEFTPA